MANEKVRRKQIRIEKYQHDHGGRRDRQRLSRIPKLPRQDAIENVAKGLDDRQYGQHPVVVLKRESLGHVAAAMVNVKALHIAPIGVHSSDAFNVKMVCADPVDQRLANSNLTIPQPINVRTAAKKPIAQTSIRCSVDFS